MYLLLIENFGNYIDNDFCFLSICPFLVLGIIVGLDLIFEICNIAVHDHVLLNTKIKWC